jgi:hypothetical protein
MVVFFNNGVDTGTVWRSTPAHEPILWRHVIWDRKSPDREAKERSPWGWLFYRRVKTDKAFYRPKNRVVHAHLRSLMPEDHRRRPGLPRGGARPNAFFQALCGLAGIKPRLDIETGEEEPWELKDLRKTCATFYDEHVPRVVGGDSGPFGRRDYVSPICPPRTACLPGDHDAAAAECVLSDPACWGQRVRALPEAVRRRRLMRSIRPKLAFLPLFFVRTVSP